MKRRTFLHYSALLLAGSAMGARSAFGQAKSLTFVSWGGSTQDAQNKAWAVPFTEKTGISVINDGPTDYGKLKAMVESGNVMWDVVDVEGQFAYKLAREGLLEPIDFNIVDRNGLDPRLTFEYGVGSFLSSYVLAYNKQFVTGEPKSWADLFDLEKFPGKRALYKWACMGALEAALLADGVKPEDVYPLDLDRAFRKLDTIKREIVWWGTGAESQQLLPSGEAPLGMFWNGRVYSMQKDGLDTLGISWAQNVPGPDMLVIPKGAPNKAAAMEFIAIASGAKGQADFSNASAYAPTNEGARAMLNEDMIEFMPFSHADQELPMNLEYWSEHTDEIGTRWYAWQAS